MHGKRLVYLDNAATTQKPRQVLDAIQHYYEHDNANVHRGVHTLSERATAAYEAARETTRAFLNAASVGEIVFTRNATEASTWSRARGATRTSAPATKCSSRRWSTTRTSCRGSCCASGPARRSTPCRSTIAAISSWTSSSDCWPPRTKIVAVAHQSNALGTVNPVAEIVQLARRAGAAVLIDGSQAVCHMPVDVHAIGADFYVFTGHKLYGPTGIGVLYGREAVLDAMPPFLGGGDMIRTVTFEKSTWNDLPYKFEAGTPHIAGAVGLGAAIDYVLGVGFDAIAAHEAALLEDATSALEAIPGVRIVGTAQRKASVLSFVMDGIHPHDIGTVVDREGVAIRTGHHCAQPVMDRLGIPATARASFAMYNTHDEVDALAAPFAACRRCWGESWDCFRS